jgi:hypothetical protein
MALPSIIYESLYRENYSPHRKRLYRTFSVELSTGQTVVIPKGFVTDIATVPRLLWGIVSPSGRHDLACIVHDYLLESGWPRGEADRELLRLLLLSRVHPAKAYLMYHCARLYGCLKRMTC